MKCPLMKHGLHQGGWLAGVTERNRKERRRDHLVERVRVSQVGEMRGAREAGVWKVNGL